MWDTQFGPNAQSSLLKLSHLLMHTGLPQSEKMSGYKMFSRSGKSQEMWLVREFLILFKSQGNVKEFYLWHIHLHLFNSWCIFLLIYKCTKLHHVVLSFSGGIMPPDPARGNLFADNLFSRNYIVMWNYCTKKIGKKLHFYVFIIHFSQRKCWSGNFNVCGNSV